MKKLGYNELSVCNGGFQSEAVYKDVIDQIDFIVENVYQTDLGNLGEVMANEDAQNLLAGLWNAITDPDDIVDDLTFSELRQLLASVGDMDYVVETILDK